MKLGVYSKGIWKIKNLAAFLSEYEPVLMQKAEAVCGWGKKPTADKPRQIAAEENIPFISLEDGFLRSHDLGVNGAEPLSMVVDRKGIYYDATTTSELEELIRQGATDDELARAQIVIAEIKQRRLTKYNHNIEQWSKPVNRPCVLVVDQCFGDLSIKYGLADEKLFAAMLRTAREENPQSHILIKTHPDVIAGKRRGYIDTAGLHDFTVITENINPYAIFPHVEKVYVAISMLGFEALIYGLPVKCFGMPFYAGWGATEDFIKCERRNVKRSVAEIFTAAYFKYTRYINPYTGMKCEVEEVMEILSFLKNAYARLGNENYTGYGFSRWKRYFVKPYLKTPENKVEFRKYLIFAFKNANRNNSTLVIWAAREKPDLLQKAKGRKIHRMEDGFIRSVGLGSDFTVASSLILDKTGIHFDHSRPSDLENILNNRDFDSDILARARNLRELILSKSITKYNIEKNDENLNLPLAKKLLLAVGQVEGDASIRFGSPVIKTNQQLVDAIRKDNPDAFIIYKPHPDVLSGNRKGEAEITGADMVISNVGIHSLIKKVDEVHTITSLVGFEALMHGKKTVVYGLPFYASWGLSVDKIKHERRTRQRNIDELVAAALLEYPSYFDFDSNLPCKPEVIVEKLATKPPVKRKPGKLRRIRNGIAGIFRS